LVAEVAVAVAVAVGRSDRDLPSLPQLQPGHNVIHNIHPPNSQFHTNWEGLGCIQHFSTFKSSKISRYLTKNIFLSIGGAPSQKLYLKNGTVEMYFLNGGDAFCMFTVPKISCLFDNNLSPNIGGPPSWKPYLKNGMVENFFDGGDAFPRVNLPKKSHLLEKNLSPGVGALPVNSTYLKNDAEEFFSTAQWRSARSIVPKSIIYLTKSLPFSGGRGIVLSPGFFPNLTLLEGITTVIVRFVP
jgi:hypothetical protein